MILHRSEGALLAGACADGAVRIWDIETGTELDVLRGHTGAVTAVAFSPDGHELASASADGTARVWDAETELLPLLNSGPGLINHAGHADTYVVMKFETSWTSCARPLTLSTTTWWPCSRNAMSRLPRCCS